MREISVQPAEDAEKLEKYNQFLNCIVRAANDHEPVFFNELLESAVSSGLTDVRHVREFVVTNYDNAYAHSGLDVDYQALEGWALIRIALENFMVRAAAEQILEESAAKTFYQAMFNRLGEAIDDSAWVDFDEDPYPDFTKDEKYEPEIIIAMQTTTGRAITDIMAEAHLIGNEVEIEHIERAKELIDLEPEVQLRGPLGTLLDIYIPACAEQYMEQAIETGEVSLVYRAYAAVACASSDIKVFPTKKAMDKDLLEFLKVIRGNDNYEEIKHTLIDSYASSYDRSEQLYQALRPRV